MKKTIALILSALMLMAALTACGSKSGNTSTPSNNNNTTNPSASQGQSAGGDLTPISAGMMEGPIVLTSVGQSADMEIIKTLCDKGGVDVYAKNLIMASELNDNYKTLILAVGGSSKGLGAAGIDADEELARTNDLIAKAKELGMKIVAVHVGGSARRGTLSDKFITPCFEIADAAIVVSEGDTDNLMRNILVAKNIPADYVDMTANALTSLKNLFGV